MNFSWYVLLCHHMHAAQAIILSDNMKKALESAINMFEAKIKSVENVNVHGDKTVNVTGDSNISYPFILWDPLPQYQNIYELSPIIYSLCLTNSLMQETPHHPEEMGNSALHPSINSYTIDNLLKGYFKTIENAKSLKEIPNTDFSLQSDYTNFDIRKTVQESFSIKHYLLLILKIILLLKSLWSTKEINIVKVPFPISEH